MSGFTDGFAASPDSHRAAGYWFSDSARRPDTGDAMRQVIEVLKREVHEVHYLRSILKAVGSVRSPPGAAPLERRRALPCSSPSIDPSRVHVTQASRGVQSRRRHPTQSSPGFAETRGIDTNGGFPEIAEGGKLREERQVHCLQQKVVRRPFSFCADALLFFFPS